MPPSLPEDLWLRIIGSFECAYPRANWWLYPEEVDVSPRRTLRALCLVSSQFCRIAQPLMFRTLLWDYYRDEDRVKRGLAVTLMKEPGLGRFARTVALSDNMPPCSFDLAGMERDANCPREALDVWKVLGHDPDYPPNEGFAAGILAFMPYVQTVDVSTSRDANVTTSLLSGCLHMDPARVSKDDTGEMVTSWKKAVGRPNFFPNLKEVILRTSGTTDGSTPAYEVEPVLLHPTLKTLRLLGVDWTRVGMRGMVWQEERSNVEVLELKECLLDAAGLKDVLTRFPSLKSLSIQFADFQRVDSRQQWEVDLEEFGRVLREHGAKLTRLHFHTLEYETVGSKEGVLGSITPLASLRHLRTTKHDLVGTPWRNRRTGELRAAIPLREVLPASLETLYLYHDNTHEGLPGSRAADMPGVEELCGLVTSGEFPELREVVVDLRLRDPTAGLRPVMQGWRVFSVEEHVRENPAISGHLHTFLVFRRE